MFHSHRFSSYFNQLIDGEEVNYSQFLPKKRKKRKRRKNRSNNMKFIPHIFSKKIEITNPPRITISPEAYEKMSYYVRLSFDEISWMGTCFEEADGSYYVGDVFLPTQEVNATTTEINGSGMAALITTLLTEYENGEELVNNLRMWGHSHVNMGTAPSGQDDQQMKDFITVDTPYFLRIICNKKGRMECSLFHYNKGFVMHDVPWSIAYPIIDDLEAIIKEEIKEKVSKLTYAYSTQYQGSGRYRYGYTGSPGQPFHHQSNTVGTHATRRVNNTSTLVQKNGTQFEYDLQGDSDDPIVVEVEDDGLTAIVSEINQTFADLDDGEKS